MVRVGKALQDEYKKIQKDWTIQQNLKTPRQAGGGIDCLSTEERRVLMTKWLAQAWKNICRQMSRSDPTQLRFTRAFTKTGAGLTIDGSEDHLIKPQGLPSNIVATLHAYEEALRDYTADEGLHPSYMGLVKELASLGLKYESKLPENQPDMHIVAFAMMKRFDKASLPKELNPPKKPRKKRVRIFFIMFY